MPPITSASRLNNCSDRRKEIEAGQNTHELLISFCMFPYQFRCKLESGCSNDLPNASP